MADFETKLRWLSERGGPVGAEELIERIEADLAGDPLVVVAKRREGTLMTKTEQTPTTRPPGRNRGAAWAVAAFVAILAVAGLYIGLEGGTDGDEVADTQPTRTTVAEDAAAADLETIEAGVAAFYSGDGDRAAELFELAERTDDQIREEAEYQAAIEARLTPSCIGGEGGVFSCQMEYVNTLTDALGIVEEVEEVDEGGSGSRVVVEDGVITEFEFPEDSWILTSMGFFLASEGRFEGWEVCWHGPFPVSCAAIQLENRDAWVEWLYESFGQFVEGGELADEYAAADCANTPSPECADLIADNFDAWETWYNENGASDLETIEAGVAAFYSGDGERAAELFELAERTDDQIREEAEYMAATEGGMTLSCIGGEGGVFTCHISSENILTDALGWVEEVDEGGSGTRVVVEDGVITEFDFTEDSWTLTAMGLFLASEGRFEGWEVCWTGPFPESCAAIQLENRDAWAEWLYESFGQFVEGGELADEYAAADCANTRSHECARLIADNFDAWETWHNENA